MSTAPSIVGSCSQRTERVVSAEYYRPDLDGLRGIAVLAVIGFHAFPDYFPGGYVGVDVFFVISGFLISSIILRQLRNSTFTFPDFYARRIRRIFPALVVVLLACILIGWLALLPDELEQLGKHVAAAAGFVSNFTLWQERGYFDVSSELKPLLHLWSLGIEEQFYLGWPLLLILLCRFRQNAALAVLMLTVASFLLTVTIGRDHSTANYYLPFTRFWELGLGCLLAIVTESSKSPTHWFNGLSRPSVLNSVLPIVGLALIVAAIFLVDLDTPFPGWAALGPTVGAMCIITARGDSWFQRHVTAWAGLVLIGVISYPLYLWHWPLLSVATILHAGTPEISVRVVAVSVSVALAWLTYRFVERPARVGRSTRTAIALVAALATLGLAGVAMWRTGGAPSRVDVDVRSLRPASRMNALCPHKRSGRDFNYCKSTSTQPPDAVFLGDSRAQGIYDGVVSEIEGPLTLALLGRGGCPPLLDAHVRYAGENDCNRTWDIFVRYVQNAKPRVVVIVGSGSVLLQRSTDIAKAPNPQLRAREHAFDQALRRLIATLQGTSRVIYVREIPSFDSAPSCFLRRIKIPGGTCSPIIPRGTVEHTLAPYNRIVDELKNDFSGLRVVDSLPALCDAKVCSQKLRSGESAYSDRIHLSPAGGRHFARASGLPRILTGE